MLGGLLILGWWYLRGGEGRKFNEFALSSNEGVCDDKNFINTKRNQSSSWTEQQIIDIQMLVHKNGTVSEDRIRVANGRPTSESILGENEGDYTLIISDKTDKKALGNILWGHTFPLYFDYNGPVVEGEDYSNIKYDTVDISYRIPYELGMESVVLCYKNKQIFYKLIPSQL